MHCAQFAPCLAPNTFIRPSAHTYSKLRTPIHRYRQNNLAPTTVCAASFVDTPTIPAAAPNGAPSPDIPSVSGVYAVYNSSGILQYIGLSRKVNISVATHLEAFDATTVASIKVRELPTASKDDLTDAWKDWVAQAVEETGAIPPGNSPGERSWQQRRPKAPKPELRLTPGKGIDDLSISLEDLVDQVIKAVPVVAFVKGTRTAPQCGFSYKVLTILSEVAGSNNFEVVNVLDEVYNPGLRDAIKSYSQWPTIPQVYVNGEFVGGADIVEQMHGTGELKLIIDEINNNKVLPPR